MTYLTRIWKFKGNVNNIIKHEKEDSLSPRMVHSTSCPVIQQQSVKLFFFSSQTNHIQQWI